MATKIILPKLGQTMEEGTIVEWFKGEGDPVERGGALFSVESDKAVLEADHYTCQHKHYNDDGTEFWFHDPTGRELQAHHIYPWRRNPHLRFDPQNGICLCRRHHQEFHDRYGKFGNTWPQLKKYLES